MNPDVTVFSQYMDAFTRIITLGHAAVLPSTVALLTSLAIITIIMIGLSLALTDGAAIPELVKVSLTVGCVIFLMQNWQQLADRVMSSFTQLGLLAGNSNMSVTDFLGSPDTVIRTGDRAFYSISMLMSQSCATSMAGCIGNLGNFLSLFVSMIVVEVIFFLIALTIFGTLIMFKLSVLASAVSLVLMVFPMFRNVGHLALLNVLRWGAQMMLLAIITGVGENIFGNIPVGTQPDITSVLGTLTAAGIFLGLVLKSGSMASAITSGTILHGGAMLAGATGSAAVGARMAGGAAKATGENISGVASRGASAIAAALKHP